jgi:AcrR family transcriptional regulator
VTTSAGPSGSSVSRQRLGEDERRAQILRATIAVVARSGYDSASASRIAEEAGVSKGLIWHYFSDKTDLMKQAASAAMTAVRDDKTSEVRSSAPAADVVRASIRWLAKLGETHRDEFRAMNQIIASLRAPDGAPAFTLLDYEDTYQDQERLFRRGQAEGSFRPFDTRVMAVTYQAAIDMMLAYIDSHPGTDTGQYADALADILLGGMAQAQP